MISAIYDLAIELGKYPHSFKVVPKDDPRYKQGFEAGIYPKDSGSPIFTGFGATPDEATAALGQKLLEELDSQIAAKKAAAEEVRQKAIKLQEKYGQLNPLFSRKGEGA